MLAKMLNLGLSAARFDLTWGPLTFHRQSLENLQEAMRISRKLCATMVDTLGREIMIKRRFTVDDNGWPVHEGTFTITAGQTITLTTRDVEASETVLPVTYDQFNTMAEAGDTIYVGRYLVCGADSASLFLRVTQVVGPDVICEAQNDAVLDGLLTVFHGERSSDNLLNVQNELPLLSEYDRECLSNLALDYEIDFLSLSYTRSGEDVKEARAFLDSIDLVNTKVYAKVETRQALLNFKGILNEADGVIISRGNLGLDCDPEKLAVIQKTLIQSCNLVGKPVLITRVCDTMVQTPRPTRAEATDVANAVLDGIDGILLGAETLRGTFPLECMATIASICRQAEKVFDHQHHFEHLMESALDAESSPPGTANDGLDNPYSSMASPNSSSDHLDGLDQYGGPTPGGHNHTHGHGLPRLGMGLKSAGVGSASYSSLNMAIRAMAKYGPGSVGNLLVLGARSAAVYSGSPYLSKLESIASSAVRAADKVKAGLIIVYTHTGKTAQLVAKYRPPMPIVTLVVPRLVSDSLHWRLEGRHNARQVMLTRNVLPMLATPSPNGDAVLEEAISMAAYSGLVQPHQHVVCVQRIHDDFCVKIVAVNSMGGGIKRVYGTSVPANLDVLDDEYVDSYLAETPMQPPHREGSSIAGQLPALHNLTMDLGS